MVLSLILNESDFEEIGIIQEAIKRRISDLNRVGSLGGRVSKMARRASEAVEEQLKQTHQQIQGMVVNFIREMLKEKAPELSEEEREALIRAWVPERGKKSEKPLPKDAILTMAEDVLASLEGRLDAARESQLREHLGEQWRKVVWSKLPERVQKLLTLFLEGRIERPTLWREINTSLDDPTP